MHVQFFLGHLGADVTEREGGRLQDAVTFGIATDGPGCDPRHAPFDTRRLVDRLLDGHGRGFSSMNETNLDRESQNDRGLRIRT